MSGGAGRAGGDGAAGGARPEAVWAVDRIESGVAVLERDGDGREAEVTEVSVRKLPPGTREGSVLRVLEVKGRPDWGAAVLDEELRRARVKEAEAILERLRRRDPGGDVVL